MVLVAVGTTRNFSTTSNVCTFRVAELSKLIPHSKAFWIDSRKPWSPASELSVVWIFSARVERVLDSLERAIDESIQKFGCFRGALQLVAPYVD